VTLVIVNSGVGNVRSVANMLRRVGVEATISDDPAAVRAADAIILPGVGSFDAAARRFRASGVADALNEKVAHGKIPVLGICLGMQLMGDRSEEGQESGFSWIGGELKRFQPSDGGADPIRVPHMGWNMVQADSANPLFEGFVGDPRFYFDHSYYFIPSEEASCTARARHGVEFAAGIRRGMLFGVQFHPEKSHRFGFQLLRNFASFAASKARAEEMST
jgi:glutamine amidotransferase